MQQARQGREELDLRAQDSQDESTPWQVAVDTARDTSVDSRVFGEVARTAGTVTLWAGENRNCDEGADEQEIDHDEDHAKHIGACALDAELESHGDEGVQNSGGEDTFDGAIGSRCATGKVDDLAEAEGEKNQGGEGGNKLEEAEETVEEGGLGHDRAITVGIASVVGARMHLHFDLVKW